MISAYSRPFCLTSSLPKHRSCPQAWQALDSPGGRRPLIAGCVSLQRLGMLSPRKPTQADTRILMAYSSTYVITRSKLLLRQF